MPCNLRTTSKVTSLLWPVGGSWFQSSTSNAGISDNTCTVGVDALLPCHTHGPFLCCAGKAGSTSLSLTTLDPSGLVAWRCLSQSTAGAAAGPGTGSLLLMCSPSKRHWRSIQTHINNAVHGVMQVGGGCACVCRQAGSKQTGRQAGRLEQQARHAPCHQADRQPWYLLRPTSRCPSSLQACCPAVQFCMCLLPCCLLLRFLPSAKFF